MHGDLKPYGAGSYGCGPGTVRVSAHLPYVAGVGTLGHLRNLIQTGPVTRIGNGKHTADARGTTPSRARPTNAKGTGASRPWDNAVISTPYFLQSCP